MSPAMMWGSSKLSRRAPWAASLAPRYGIRTAREAHDWFLSMMQENEEFEVETDEPGEWPMPFCSETVRWVMVE